MNLEDHWSADLVEWMWRKFPIDLAGRELYLISDVEAGPSFHAPGAVAWVGVGLDQRLQPRLEDAGLWRGPGDVVIVQAAFSRLSAEQWLAILTHEFAHCLEFRGATIPPEQLARWRDFDRQRDERARRGEVDGLFAPESAAPWSGHENRFIRAGLHLAIRAKINPDDCLIAGEAYGLSPAKAYVEALADEPQRLAGLPVAEILKTPAPPAFDDLFAADVAKFNASQAV